MREKKILLRAGIVLLSLLSLYLFLKLKVVWNPLWMMVQAIVIPFLIASFITYLLHPIVEKLHETGLPRTLSILVIYLLFFGSLGYGFYRGLPLLINQLMELSANAPRMVKLYEGWLTMIRDQTDHWPMGLHHRVEDLLGEAEQWLSGLIDQIILSIRSIFDNAVILALIPFLVFYMLKDIELLKRTAWYLTPKNWRRRGKELIRDADASLGSYIRGQFFVCVIIGLLAFLSLWIFGVKYPLVLGIIIAVTNIIPYFGPVIGAIPALILAAAMSTETVITVVIIILVLQFLEGNVISPLIVGRSLHMHPIVIMLALAAGGELAGIFGLIIAVPVTAVLRVLVEHGVRLLKAH
ncbi:AI-2E family transporter [Bacillus mangrovi]|uniref:AI-2E family transporter n=1 Tax=Metabacillus mangrovi TaxID=1491830 RepID=A0A7X2S3F4_9BACI|nr:AI-2E family transporter [Metabacillus mangrovi]MTH52526.1 AI-2E family transporter [Metabacillus mangrovi]